MLYHYGAVLHGTRYRARVWNAATGTIIWQSVNTYSLATAAETLAGAFVDDHLMPHREPTDDYILKRQEGSA
jgi:hypothetical protein